MTQAAHRYASVPSGEPRLLEGAALFNARRYFESHEVWESLWHDVGGQDREMLQGLIQWAAAYHHLASGNLAGAQYLYARGRLHLAPWLPARAGIDLQALVEIVDRDFAVVAGGRRLVAPPVVRITSSP